MRVEVEECEEDEGGGEEEKYAFWGGEFIGSIFLPRISHGRFVELN